jgi:glycosyltransferase 2 family protein
MTKEQAPGQVAFNRLMRGALIVVPIGVLANIVFSLLTTDREVLARVSEFPRAYLLLALFLGLVPWLTATLRTVVWVRFLGYTIPMRTVFRMTLAGELGTAVTPTAVGGGLFKLGMLVQHGVSPGAAISVATLTNIEDALFFLVALPIAFLASPWRARVALPDLAERIETPHVGPGVILLWVLIALIAWVITRSVYRGVYAEQDRREGLSFGVRVRTLLRTTWLDGRAALALVVRRGKSRLALTLSLTAVQWSCRYSVISALAAFLGAPVDLLLFFVLQWAVFTVMIFVPTPGATGGAEAAFFLLYRPFLPSRIIGMATAGWRFLTFYVQLALAALVMMIMNIAERRRADATGR